MKHNKKSFCTVNLLKEECLSHTSLLRIIHNELDISAQNSHWGSHNSTLLFPRKTENTVTWLNIMWYILELSIDKHENNVKKHVVGAPWSGTKRGRKRGQSNAKKRKKEEIWCYSQVANICLWTEFGSFLQTHNKK